MKTEHPEAIKAQLGNKERTIKIGPAALRIGKLLKKTTFTLTDLADAPDMGNLAHLVFLGLLVDEPELEELQVMQWLADTDEGELLGLVAARLLAMANQMADNMGDLIDEEEEGEEETEKKS